MTEEQDKPVKLRIVGLYRKIVPLIMLTVVVFGTVYSVISFSSESTQSPSNYALQATNAQGTYTVNTLIGSNNCTGVTSKPITIKSSGNVSLSVQYAVASVNVTNLFMFVKLSIGTIAPTTIFTSGTCAAPFTCQWISSTYIPITGAANWFPTVFNVNAYTGGFCPKLTVGLSYYAWIDIQQRGGVGHASIRQETQNDGGMLLREL